MHLALISNGNPQETMIVDLDSGEPVENLVGYSLERCGCGGPELLTLTVAVPGGLADEDCDCDECTGSCGGFNLYDDEVDENFN